VCVLRRECLPSAHDARLPQSEISSTPLTRSSNCMQSSVQHLATWPTTSWCVHCCDSGCCCFVHLRAFMTVWDFIWNVCCCLSSNLLFVLLFTVSVQCIYIVAIYDFISIIQMVLCFICNMSLTCAVDVYNVFMDIFSDM